VGEGKFKGVKKKRTENTGSSTIHEGGGTVGGIGGEMNRYSTSAKPPKGDGKKGVGGRLGTVGKGRGKTYKF